ncbi:MAG: MBL fold metallo-hydrolase [Candidatus Komeilibacteria bacterium]|nr:MBL fold metallo-hydrolase [Candidatus Komeilibacteria bacterium]
MKKSFKILIGSLVVIAVLFGLVWHTGSDQNLEVYFFNVGQGDGILIRTPSQQNIIIDGGPDNAFITKLGQALPFYDQQIDLMVLTHPHADHLFGLIEVLKRYRVKRVLYSGVVFNNSAYDEWLKQIKQKQIPLVFARAGQDYRFGQVELKVLFPIKSEAGQVIKETAGEGSVAGQENLNNTSVVTQLIYGQTKILFMGDLEAPGEEEILKSNPAGLASQVIKIGHHGSATASSQRFLAQVKPQDAVIQVGLDNKFNLPNAWVLGRLKRLKIGIWRTDLLGDIKLFADGFKLKLGPVFKQSSP